ncbi:MAG: class I SAM-dependent methyltransferase [Rhodoglobus sp.]|nr:class I SAM-dependent methyltransferase [Rhodoglobus sp.]
MKSSVLAFVSQRFPRLSSHVLASSGYTFDLDSFGPDAFGVWKQRAATRQDAAWQPIVAQAKHGSPREDVVALFAALDALPADTNTLLEVGCGGGYVSELIVHHRPDLTYEGLDISSAMIEIARSHYPGRTFVVGSADALPHADASADVVLDGVALLHILRWKAALAEYARVAASTVILHGLTLTDSPTATFAKYAYGQPSMELVFNRDELLTECVRLGLTLTDTFVGLDYDLEDVLGIRATSETWVLAR